MSHPVDEHVGKKLKTLRMLRRMSQTDVAKRLNISFQQVQKYELGRNRVSASKLYEISQILSVPPAEFFDGLDGTVSPATLISETDAKLLGIINQIPDGPQKAQLIELAKALSTPAKRKTSA